jgi:hypothetical protein
MVAETPSRSCWTCLVSVGIMGSSKSRHQLLYNGRAAVGQMVKSISCHDIIQRPRRLLEELKACFLEPLALVLLSKGQRGGRGTDVDVPAQDVLADEFEPLHAIPVGGDEQVLSHKGLFFLGLGLGQRVGVDEVQQVPEHVRPHLIYLHLPGGKRRLLHGAEQLGLEHGRPHREHAAMRRELLPVHPEAHVGAQLAPQEFAQVLRQVRRRNADERDGGGRGSGGGVLGAELGDDADVAADAEGVVLEVPRLLQRFPPDEGVEAPVRAGGVEPVHGEGLGEGRHRLAGTVEKADAELRERGGAVGGCVLENEVERDVVGRLRAVAVGEVSEVPGVAADAERAGLEVDAGGEALGARVAVDLEHVRADSGGGDDGGR